MKRFYRRRELLLYRIVFFGLFITTVCILIKGLVVVASDDINRALKRAGVYAMQSLYLGAIEDKSTYSRYVITNKSEESNVLTNFADNYAINYYAAHDSSDVTVTETLLPDEMNEYEYLEDQDEYNRHYVTLGDDLEKKVLEENEVNTDESIDGKRLEIAFTEGKVSYIENYDKSSSMSNYVLEDSADFAVSVSNLIKTQYSLDKLKQFDYLVQNYYIVDQSTSASKDVFDTDVLLTKNLTIQKSKAKPQILIYHTHASETYLDSRPGVQADTVVGPGNYLAELLESYGYSVYHDKTAYDMKDGVGNRDYAYSTARPQIEKILAENPSIEVVIDLHRDSGKKRIAEVNGKSAAQIMLFNGLCRNQNGPIDRLENVNLQSNLAFSLQMNLVGRSLFPGLMHRIYLKNYRYNMHFKERCLLVELGTDMNTVQEAYNSIEPLALILDQVLSNR